MEKHFEVVDDVTVRFAGDSGDGMQIVGTQFSNSAGAAGNDVNTFPDYPSEIRAPEGTLYGVSAYQVHFGSKTVNTIGDKIDVLFAMNAASLKVNLKNLNEGSIIVANSAGFNDKDLKLAEYDSNPLVDGSLAEYELYSIDIPSIMKDELQDLNMTLKHIDRTKNFFALGLAYWLFDRPMEFTISWLKKKFGKNPISLESNIRALHRGYRYGLEGEQFKRYFKVPKADLAPGIYRNITGNEATALGLVAASKNCGLPLYLGSYPITPATEILHYLSGYRQYNVRVLQAEDEIAGITSAIGASYAGNLAATSTSGPGFALKVEAMGLAVMMELPLVIIDVQRAGPSTGMPTKPEQGDLLMAIYGRHGESPIPVFAAKSPADCFDITYEAAQIAIKYMTPVIVLTDGYLAQGTEPWKVPQLKDLPLFKPQFANSIPEFAENPESYKPYIRNPETLARYWAIPGMPGFENQIGGLEKQDGTGVVSQDPMNHQKIVELRAQKVENIAKDLPLLEIEGEQEGDLLIIGWGSTYGAIKVAFNRLRNLGHKLSFVHLRYLNPFPANLEEIISKFDRVFVPEMNLGQLQFLLQGKFLKSVIGYHKIQGKPMSAIEVENALLKLLNNEEL
ncbi:MAG: 2-oxoacid:acceptor oxidoreductase subunit alpha [Chloroherpetonaceae bacterium]